MVDTTISAQTAISPVLGTYYVPLAAGGLPRKATLADLQAFVNKQPTFAAGSAAAASWPKFTAGTLLTTPEAGAFELDTTNFYATVEASNRGIVPLEHWIRANTARTFASNTTPQAIFNSPTNGALTLSNGIYVFRVFVGMDTLSATSGNGKFSLAGTAVLAQILQNPGGIDISLDSTTTVGGTMTQSAAQGATNAAPANAATDFLLTVEGTFSVTTGGTVIPSFAQTTASAANVKPGSYCWFKRIGANGLVSGGNWS